MLTSYNCYINLHHSMCLRCNLFWRTCLTINLENIRSIQMLCMLCYLIRAHIQIYTHAVLEYRKCSFYFSQDEILSRATASRWVHQVNKLTHLLMVRYDFKNNSFVVVCLLNTVITWGCWTWSAIWHALSKNWSKTAIWINVVPCKCRPVNHNILILCTHLT